MAVYTASVLVIFPGGSLKNLLKGSSPTMSLTSSLLQSSHDFDATDGFLTTQELWDRDGLILWS